MTATRRLDLAFALTLMATAAVLVFWLQKLREDNAHSVLSGHQATFAADLGAGRQHAAQRLESFHKRLSLLGGLPIIEDLVDLLAVGGGRLSASPALHAAEAEIRRTFDAAVEAAADFQRLRLVLLAGGAHEWIRLEKNPDGQALPTPAAAPGTQAAEPWWSRALTLAPGQILFSTGGAQDPTATNEAPSLRPLALTGVVPLHDAEGRMVGLLVVDLDPSELLGDLTQHLSELHGAIVLIDEQQHSLTHPRSGRILAGFSETAETTVPARPGGRLASLPLPPGLRVLQDPQGATLLAVTGELGLGPADQGERLRIWAGAPLPRLEQQFERRYTAQRERALWIAAGFFVLWVLTFAQLRRREGRRALARIEGERAHAQNLIDQIPVALAMFDTEFRFLTVNARYKKLAGFDENADLRGRQVFDCIPTAVLWEENFERALAGEAQAAREDPIEGPREAGQPDTVRRLFLDWALTPWRAASGEIGGVIAWIQDVTANVEEQRRIEDALAVSTRSLHAVADAAPILIAQCDLEGRYQFVNKGFAGFVGATPAQIIGRHAREVLGPELFPQLSAAVSAAYAGKSSELEVREVRAGVPARAFLARTAPVLAGNGQPLGAVAALSDISTLKAAHQSLAESESYFRVLFEENPDIFVVFSLNEFKILDCNVAATQAFELPREALLQLSLLDLSAPTQLSGQPTAEAIPAALRHLADRNSGPLEWLILRPDGSLMVVEVTGRVASYGGGEALFALGRDVSALRQLRNFQATLIHSAGEAVIATNPQGLITLFNPAAEQLFGYPSAEVIGNLRLDDLHAGEAPAADAGGSAPTDAPLGRDSLATCLVAARAHEKITREWLCVRADGSFVTVLCSLSALRGDTGEILGYLALVRDISERRRLMADLGQRLEERTTLLEEIHHRVKNNLQIISSLLALQQRQTRQPEVVEQIQVSRDRVAAIAMVHQHLYLGGSLNSINFGNYARELLADVLRASGAEARGVECAIQGPGFVLELNEAVPCALILSELVTNALKHAFPEGRRGHITVELSTAADGTREMLVSDDGLGLGPEPAKRPAGLGTKLVNRLAAQLGASLRQEQPPGGQGTAWRLVLPASATPA